MFIVSCEVREDKHVIGKVIRGQRDRSKPPAFIRDVDFCSAFYVISHFWPQNSPLSIIWRISLTTQAHICSRHNFPLPSSSFVTVSGKSLEIKEIGLTSLHSLWCEGQATVLLNWQVLLLSPTSAVSEITLQIKKQKKELAPKQLV